MTPNTPTRSPFPRKCPICGKPAADDASNKYFPFCGERCKTIDLARWAEGKYKITRAVEESDLDEEA